jgi:integrase/recombinase XerD
MELKAYLEPTEVKRLEQATEYLRDKLLIRLLFRLGCRISEVLGIGVDDVSFSQGTVTIEHLKVRVKLSCPACATRLSKTSRFCPGCGVKVEKAVAEEKEHHRQRTLPVDTDTLSMLREYIDRGGPIQTNGKQLLFGLKRSQASNIIRECAQRAGLGPLVNPETGEPRGISPHRLRDAFAVHAIKVNDSTDGVRMLQEHLGHQSIVTTMKYRKVSGEEQKEWYQKLWGDNIGEKNGHRA